MASAYDVEGGRGTDRLCLEPDSLVYSGAVGGASNSSDGQNQPSWDVPGRPGFLLPRVRNDPVETTSSAESTGLRFWNGTRSCCSVCDIMFDSL